MRRRILGSCTVLAALVTLGGLSLATSATPAAAAAPTVEISPSNPQVGQEVQVSGTFLPSDTNLRLEVCGNGGLNGDADCDYRGATTTRAWDSTLDAKVVISAPPAPCPCILRIQSETGSFSYDLPLRIDGDPTAGGMAPSAPEGTLRVTSMTINGSGPWTSMVGGSAERTLVMTVQNVGSVTVDNPVLTVRIGRTGISDTVINAPSVPTITPGQFVLVRVPFEIPPVAVGTYTISGEVGRVGATTTFSTTTTTWPVGLIIAALVLIQLIVLAILRRNRRIRLRREAEVAAAAAADAESSVAVVEDPDAEVVAGTVSEAADLDDTVPEPDTMQEGPTDLQDPIPPEHPIIDGPVTAAPWH